MLKFLHNRHYNRWTPLWILQKASFYKRKWSATIETNIYIFDCNIKTILYNLQRRIKPNKNKSQKYLYASPVGKEGKQYLAKIIQQFGHENFDYLIFVYDDTEFNEEIYRDCKFIYEKGIVWSFAKKYLTPEYCKKYDFIFFWNDDIDIENFSYKNFITIMERNNLEVAQPALSLRSEHSYEITLKNEKYKVGRFTDFVEIMIPVFANDAWAKMWHKVEKDYNFWGWGYDLLAKSLCKYINMGIIDCETVSHARLIQSGLTTASKGLEIFFEKYKKYKKTLQITYGKLK